MESRIDRFDLTLETAAGQAGFHVLDEESGYFEVEFRGTVDRPTLLAFVTAMRTYGERELQFAVSDSGLVVAHS